MTGRPKSSILDDLCLDNVISKYFSKLRFGTTVGTIDLGTNQSEPTSDCGLGNLHFLSRNAQLAHRLYHELLLPVSVEDEEVVLEAHVMPKLAQNVETHPVECTNYDLQLGVVFDT